MININAVNKTSDKQSILPPFAEHTDNKSNSFRDILNGVRNDNNFMPSLFNNGGSFNNNGGSFYPNREKNSFSNYGSRLQAQSYAEKNASNSYGSKFQDNRYDKDRYAYDGVENKVYNDNFNAGVSKNRKDKNNVTERTVFEKRDVKELGNNYERDNTAEVKRPAANSSRPNNKIDGSEENIENNMVQEDLPVEISVKDLISLLQAAFNSSSKASNDENAKQNSETKVTADTEVDIKPENIVETIAAKLHINNDLKAELKDILNSIQLLSEDDISKMLQAVTTSISKMEELGLQVDDELSLMQVSKMIMASISDTESLDTAYDDLKDKIKSFEQNILKSSISDNDKTAENNGTFENIENILGGKDNNNSAESENTQISSKAVEMLNNIVSLIEKSVDEGKPLDKEQITLAKEILASVKTVLENKNNSSQDTSKLQALTNELENGLEKAGLNNSNQQNTNTQTVSQSQILDKNSSINLVDNKADTSLKTSVIEDNKEIQDTAEKSNIQDIEPELKADNSQVNESKVVKNDLSDKVKIVENTKADTVNNTSSNEQVEEQVKDVKQASADEVEENMKDKTKLSENTTKDQAKQTESAGTKDLQKEFKTTNTEAENSLRNQAQAKADAKAATVNLTDTGKGLSNQPQNKQGFTPVNNQGENFSTIQNDKGNNFNQFLKSSAEAQAKYDNQQAKESQTPYNMKEPRDIERLVRTMQSSVHKGESKLTVVLTPENLGKLQIHLSETGGKITAKFMAENESSHKLIMAQSDLLKNQLSEKGIVVDNMEFAFNDTMSKGQNGEDNGRRANRNSHKQKGFKGQNNDLEVGTEVASNKSSGIYA